MKLKDGENQAGVSGQKIKELDAGHQTRLQEDEEKKKEEEKEEKISHMCESIGHRPLFGQRPQRGR